MWAEVQDSTVRRAGEVPAGQGAERGACRAELFGTPAFESSETSTEKVPGTEQPENRVINRRAGCPGHQMWGEVFGSQV